MTSEEYDQMLASLSTAPPESEPSWVVARSPEAAYAFAQWCVDNDIEEPAVRIIKHHLET